MEKHLKPKQYYIDLYDEVTVSSCRGVEDRYQASQKKVKGEDVKVKMQANYGAYYLMMYYETGERYLKKEETIREWMDRDKKQDELLESARPPKSVTCLTCKGLLKEDVRTLHDDSRGEERVMFIMRCKNGCKKGRAFFDNGEEWLRKAKTCDKCGNSYREETEKKKEVVTTYYYCDKCGHNDKYVLDFAVKEKKVDEKFEEDRAKYCLDEKKGQEFVEFKTGLEGMKNLMDDIKERDKNKDKYDRVKKMNKLTIDGLDKKITQSIKTKKYSKLQLSEPEMGKDVQVSFTVRDTDKDREEYDSKRDFKKAIVKSLSDTNWRLMSSGIDYRLGILSGRLRGYDREEDLLKLVK